MKLPKIFTSCKKIVYHMKNVKRDKIIAFKMLRQKKISPLNC